VFIGVVRDITERRLIERMKNEFISTVSHELRTPLTSIAGSLGLLAGGVGGELPEKSARLIRIAHKNSERLVRLINDLLDMEKIETGKMDFQFAPTQLLALVDQIVEANRGYALATQVEIRRDPDAVDGCVLVDTDRLTQVLTNLISNAVKFSPRSGRVTLQIIDHGNILRVIVHDDGPGIPDEFREHIFDKFAQADASDARQKGGTGQGLSSAKRIVERHGGRIGFDSDVHGGGTNFWVDLQKWEEHLDRVADVAPRVLICDSDVAVAATLSALLNEAGIDADVAHTLAQARQQLANHIYSALALDLLLPDGDSLSLLQQLRDNPRTQALPVIAMTAQTDMQHQIEHIGALQVAGWLRKPVQPHELCTVMQHAVHTASPQRLRVLHVEDDSDVISVVRVALQDIATVVAIKTLGVARELLRHERFDAIVLDINLPDGSGTELLDVLQQQPAAITPVVIFSAQDPGAAVAARVQGALIKSKASLDDLIAAIKALVQPAQGAADNTAATGEQP
jgi:DNA-binding response OmpR family regulator